MYLLGLNFYVIDVYFQKLSFFKFVYIVSYNSVAGSLCSTFLMSAFHLNKESILKHYFTGRNDIFG